MPAPLSGLKTPGNSDTSVVALAKLFQFAAAATSKTSWTATVKAGLSNQPRLEAHLPIPGQDPD
jgi:hypothetical protein